MDIPGLREEILKETRLSFTLSGGPGGQNVNKVHTRVTGHLSLDSLSSLNDAQRHRIRQKLSGRLNTQGEIYLSVQKHRTQRANREELYEALEALILASLVRAPHRRKTKPTRASKERRLEAKKRHSQRKQQRRTSWD